MASLNEEFFSVQGEGRFAGMPMQFVRFYGCNLDCSWCDQPSALTTRPAVARFHELDNEAIAELVTRHHISVPACFTGGEPFMQTQHLTEIVKLIRKEDSRHKTENGSLRRLLTIETNGTFYSDELASELYLSMSPKFDEKADKLLNLADETVASPLTAYGEQAIKQWVSSRAPMHLKFVVTSEKQFEGILEWSQKMVPNLLRRGSIPLYFQPEFFSFREGFKKIIQKYMDSERWRDVLTMGFEEVRFIPQLHKTLHVR